MISFHEVSFGYPGTDPIFAALELRIREGKTTAVMGPSGSGKTTLLKLACGLLVPTSGRIRIGRDEVRLGAVRGLVFHDDTLLPWLRVVDNAMLAPMDTAVTQDRARAMLTKFGLGDAMEAYPHELSAGMRKRVEFARALLSDDRLLLLDEPFVSLDHETRKQFWALWRNSNDLKSRTIVIITHDLEEIRAIADEVIVFNTGRPTTIRPPVQVSTIKDGTLNLPEDIPITLSATLLRQAGEAEKG